MKRMLAFFLALIIVVCPLGNVCTAYEGAYPTYTVTFYNNGDGTGYLKVVLPTDVEDGIGNGKLIITVSDKLSYVENSAVVNVPGAYAFINTNDPKNIVISFASGSTVPGGVEILTLNYTMAPGTDITVNDIAVNTWNLGTGLKHLSNQADGDVNKSVVLFCTVTFKDYNGEVLDTQVVKQGSAATAPAAPTREGYSFTGWDKDISVIQADTTVTATYDINKYTVIFADYNSIALDVQIIEHGSAATAPADPVREGYTFTGWDKGFANITADTVVNATYDINKYTVTFKDYDGTVLGTKTVEHGSAATAPAAPVRVGYTFTGWDKDFASITVDTVVTATYKINTYTVTFKDYNGKVLSTQTIEHGKGVTAPADPVREGYTFTGWDKGFANITADTVVNATYDINKYTVTFKDYDGTVLGTKIVEHGSGATFAAPVREGYTFTGWDKAFDNIVADTVVTATYKINTYTVSFADYDGKVLSTQTIEHGKGATAPADPTRVGYTFTGWDKSFASITADTVVTATYNINTYTVSFTDYDGKVLSTQTVEYGKGATAPAAPAREGYTFTGWDKAFDNIVADTVVTATYKLNTYTVCFADYDGKVIYTETVEHGKGATAPADPVREGCTFIGWDKSFDSVTADITVTATYKSNVLIGDVNGDGKVNSLDAAMILRADAGLLTLTDTQKLAGDVNGDGKVNSLDAAKVLRFDAGLLEKL